MINTPQKVSTKNVIQFSKNLYKLRLFVVFILLLIIIIFTPWALKNYKSDNPLLPKVAASGAIIQNSYPSSHEPVRIEIPSIKINAAIERVGLTKDNAMGAPAGPSNVGWYSLGAIPGDIGSSVMDGHSGWKNNLPAVFDDLYKIKVGDEILIKTSGGDTITFIVKEIKLYNPKADASKIFISSDGLSHLNLITCTGKWNSILKTHMERLVVFADKK